MKLLLRLLVATGCVVLLLGAAFVFGSLLLYWLLTDILG